MSLHANIHHVEKWSVEETEMHGGTADCRHVFYARRIVIHADGVRHEFCLMADDRETLEPTAYRQKADQHLAAE